MGHPARRAAEGLRRLVGPFERGGQIARALVGHDSVLVHVGHRLARGDRVPERLDGVFSDFADTAVAARVLHRLATDPEFAPCFTGDANRRGHGACRGSDD